MQNCQSWSGQKTTASLQLRPLLAELSIVRNSKPPKSVKGIEPALEPRLRTTRDWNSIRSAFQNSELILEPSRPQVTLHGWPCSWFCVILQHLHTFTTINSQEIGQFEGVVHTDKRWQSRKWAQVVDLNWISSALLTTVTWHIWLHGCHGTWNVVWNLCLMALPIPKLP